MMCETREESRETPEALWNRALWHLGRRDYGSEELRQRLLRPRPNNKPVPDAMDLEDALARLQELGLLDDEGRARRLAASLGQKGWSGRKIQMELRARGLPALEDLPNEEDILEDDGDVIARLLETKYAAKLGDERGRRAVYQALLRRGFRHGDIRRAMGQLTIDS